MTSNYPPGVSGNEWQIAGPDFERDEHRDCPTEGFTLRTIEPYGVGKIEEALEALLAGSEMGPVLAHLRTALVNIETVDVDGPCPFSGDVTVQGSDGVITWECPVCRTVHEEEPDTPGSD